MVRSPTSDTLNFLPTASELVAEIETTDKDPWGRTELHPDECPYIIILCPG